MPHASFYFHIKHMREVRKWTQLSRPVRVRAKWVLNNFLKGMRGLRSLLEQKAGGLVARTPDGAWLSSAQRLSGALEEHLRSIRAPNIVITFVFNDSARHNYTGGVQM